MTTAPRYHFSGIAGAGMSPLARLVRAWGHEVQGSDRSFDQGQNAELARRFTALGIALVPQDGGAIVRGLDRVVYSTAVEADTPELVAARALGIALVPRPALLAEIVDAGRPGVAIAGTSGKSTVTGMVAWTLGTAGLPATVIGGAALAGEEGGGCFVAGPREGPVVAETCESDGTLVGYHPDLAVILNVSRDHGELEALRAQFAAFAANARRLLVNAGCAEAAAIGCRAGGRPFGGAALEVTSVGPWRATGALVWNGRRVALDLPQPGRHTLENAAAAAVVALELGVTPEVIGEALRRFPGVARRFEATGTTTDGIHVVDDYAHNGAKIRAAVTAAQAGAERVLAVFQPHGFGPARFLRAELRLLMPDLLRPRDRLCYAEIFYAGGTVTRDISSRDLAADVGAAYASDHAAVRTWVASEARPGDTVLVMGARDPRLPALARAVLADLTMAPADRG